MLDQTADQRLFLGFAPPAFVAARGGLDPEAACLLQQELADRQGSCRRLPRRNGLRRGMVLDLARNRISRNSHAVDAHHGRLGERREGVDSASHGSLRRRGMDEPGGAPWREPGTTVPGVTRNLLSRADHLIAAPAEIPDRRAPHMDEPREREDEEDRHAEEQMQLEDRDWRRRPATPTPGCRVRMPCAQVMNFTISWPSRWLSETGMVARPEEQLRVEQQQDGDVAEGGGVADARIEQAPMHQERRCR